MEPAIVVTPTGLFCLTTRTFSYAFGADEQGLLRHLHWGAPIPADDLELPAVWDPSSNDLVEGVVPQEYPPHGGFRFQETCLTVTTAAGTRQLQLVPAGHSLSETTLVVTMADEVAGVEVRLRYRLHLEHDLLERSTEVINTGVEPITVNALASAQFHIPYEGLTLHNVHGMWAGEQQLFSQAVGPGKVVLESRRGISSHHHNPYFVLDRGASQTSGQVWFGVLAWSGNFRCSVEQPPAGGTQVTIGVNDFDFALVLPPGESVTGPAVLAGYTAQGVGDMSNRLHEYARSQMSAGVRPVLYNSWEATGFDVTVDNQVQLARLAAGIGAELFVLDDGWFGRRDSQADGLGDWWPSRSKFPDGLTPLISQVRAEGMQFGLWVEPEMVNPASDLYAQHPDWVHRDPDRRPATAREQLVLNLGRDDVRDHLVDVLDDLLTNHDIAYLKWDANRPMAEVGAGQDVWFRHTQGVYDVVRRIRERHPGLLIEACASGGGRIDFGALEVFDDFWTSDNTDALDRLDIQSAYSWIYPPKAMRAWVTDSPNFLTQRPIPLDFRFRVAMLGSLGIGANLATLSTDELDHYRALVAEYRAVREVVQDGRFHRLDNPSPNPYRVFQYVHGDRSVVFVFLPSTRIGRRPTRVRLRGLDPAATYTFRHEWRDQHKTGAYLMNRGLDVWLLGDHQSAVIDLRRAG